VAEAGAAARRGARPAAPPLRRDTRQGPGTPPQLDALIHHRLRLGILSALAATDVVSFNELKGILKTTDGNLSVHARKLEDAGYVTCTKTFEGRRPRTEYRLAAPGRTALHRYLNHMEALIQATRDTLTH